MKNSLIEWTDHTFNPWIGCSKVSEGCRFCYAEAISTRFKYAEWGPNGTRKRTSENKWREPFTWQRQAEREGARFRVFCASMADVFEDRRELKRWREDLVELIHQTPNLDWQLLTKRPQNILKFWKWDFPGNVWVGTSVENQKVVGRLDYLCEVPARVRFVSAEPLLGPLNLAPWLPRLQWVIAGGESGASPRPMNPDWVRELRDQCANYGVPYFFKQWGGRNKKANGRTLDRKLYNGFPA